MKPEKAKRDTVYVLPRHGLMFCMVPKVASTSIHRAVAKSLGLAWDDHRANREETDYWLPPEEAAKLELRAVGVIREPVDRFRSAFAYRQRVGFVRRWEPVETVDDCIRQVRRMFQDEPIVPDVHFARQAPLLTPVETPGRFDRIGEWWAGVQALSAVPLPDLPECNGASCEKPALSDEQVQELRELYRDDLELYARAA